MNLTDRLFVGFCVLLLIFGMWLICGRAQAQDGAWLPRRGCEWRRDCHIRYFHRNPRHQPKVYSYEQRDPGPRCNTYVSATGEERYGAERAKEAATAAWMERVRYLYGVRYMDTRNARHLEFSCGRSSTGNRASEKTAEVAGRFLEQCELRAQPCKADKEPEDDRR